jgi:hypothetical protein
MEFIEYLNDFNIMCAKTTLKLLRNTVDPFGTVPAYKDIF